MTLRKQIAIIVIATLLLIGGIGTIVWQKRKQFIAEGIMDYQDLQMSYADQVAQKVQFSFTKLRDDLYALSQIPEVQFLEKNTCLLNMVRVQKLNASQIDSIYRVDKSGKLRYSFPRSDCPVEGTQLQTIFNICRTTGNSVFQVIRKEYNGSDFLVIAQPVYTVQGDVHLNPSNKFSGLLFFIITLNELQNYFFSTSYLGDRGYPWIIDEEALLVSTANFLHLGKRFSEFLPKELQEDQQQEILAILEKMKKGQKGTGKYTYNIHQDIKGNYYKLTAYTPLKLPHQTWSIAVSTPITDVLVPLEKRIGELRVFSLSLIFILAGMCLLTIHLLKRNQQQQLYELSRKEEENRRIRKQWQITFDTVDSMVFLLDREFTIIKANIAANNIQSHDHEPLTGKNLHSLLHDYTFDTSEIKASQILQNKKTYTTKITSANDNRIYLVTILPVKTDAADFEVDLICLIKDITEMEVLQDQVHRAQKMESIGIMAGGVAHDLNNILSGFVTYPELILMNLPENSELRRPIESILSSGLLAAAVVDDMLTIARGIATEKSIENVNDLILTYLDSPEHAKLQSNYPDINFETQLSPDVHAITCSPIHAQKCLMNLAINGAEAISQTGRIIFRSENRISNGDRATELTPGKYVVISVIDSGEGISVKDQERIFEPFYTKKLMGKSGTGLGLTVVWNTMQDHGGGVDVTSGPEGTRFSLFFPAASQQLTQKEGTPKTTDINGNKERILVVDDQELQREIALKLLNSFGYEATSVRSGEEALVFLQDTQMDLILLDMKMDPGMNGCETYEKILEIYPNQRAIIASGYSEDKHVKKALRLGASSFIKKPYSISEIGKAVDAALNE